MSIGIVSKADIEIKTLNESLIIKLGRFECIIIVGGENVAFINQKVNSIIDQGRADIRQVVVNVSSFQSKGLLVTMIAKNFEH